MLPPCRAGFGSKSTSLRVSLGELGDEYLSTRLGAAALGSVDEVATEPFASSQVVARIIYSRGFSSLRYAIFRAARKDDSRARNDA